MTLRLNDEDAEALRRRAEAEGRSVREVVRDAILAYTGDRPARLARTIETIRTEDSDLLRRLSE